MRHGLQCMHIQGPFSNRTINTSSANWAPEHGFLKNYLEMRRGLQCICIFKGLFQTVSSTPRLLIGPLNMDSLKITWKCVMGYSVCIFKGLFQTVSSTPRLLIGPLNMDSLKITWKCVMGYSVCIFKGLFACEDNSACGCVLDERVY